MATIVIPDFTYTAHFYPEILEDLTLYMRQNCPELTDEDPVEPHIQLIRSFSISYHLNSVLLDIVANEMFLPTAKLRASHAALLALIGVQLKQASPASADILAKLSKTFTAAQTLVKAQSLFATVETQAAQSVEYELLADVALTMRTDLVGKVYTYDALSATYVDHTVAAQNPAGSFTTGWTPQAGDALYIGHPDVLWNQTNIAINVAASGLTGIWEYFDGNFDEGVPTSVTNLGAALQFNVNSILGTASRAGTTVRVRSAITGAFQDLTVTYVGGNNLITTSGANSFLGQTSPSTTPADYIVGRDWHEFVGLGDTTASFTVTGALTYTLPETITQAWSKTTVGSGVLAVNGYWLRFRIISVGGSPVAPTFGNVRIDEGDQFLVFEVTQGVSRSDNPLASSDGTASQEFTFTNFPVIDDTNIVVTVNEGGVNQTYTRVDNFLNSLSTDRNYTLAFDDDGAAIITFGDGVNGKIPPAGVNNIQAKYRTMDDVDGNVGANTITVNRTGVAYLSDVTNPQAAEGFLEREGSTDADLTRLKVAGPAQLRVRQRAVAPQDVPVVARAFVAADGSTPVQRALAIEESFGPKTVECVVVGPGGGLVDASKLVEIENYFNGVDNNTGVLLLNSQLTATNFTPHAINVTLTLTGGNVTSVLTALTGLLNPLALKSDGTYQWSFGGLVTLAKLYETIMDTSPEPGNAIITTPSADVALASRELPTVGTITINGVAYTP